MTKKKLKLKISLPAGATVNADRGDSTKNLLLYEVDQLDILEEVAIDRENCKFFVKDGQFISKGDIIFTEGFLGHKALVADFPGIVEIQHNKCRILGQKRRVERQINFPGKILRIVPDRFVEIESEAHSIKPIFYTNDKTTLTEQVYFTNKSEIKQDKIKFPSTGITYFVNDTLYIDDLAKMIALGAKKIIVQGIFINNFETFKNEIRKLESFAILFGFGEFITTTKNQPKERHDILWGKNKIYTSNNLINNNVIGYEHPFWGIQGDYEQLNELIGVLDYNKESLEFYLKNLSNI